MTSEHCSLAYEEIPEPSESQKEEKGYQPELNLVVNRRFREKEASSEVIAVTGNISLSF